MKKEELKKPAVLEALNYITKIDDKCLSAIVSRKEIDPKNPLKAASEEECLQVFKAAAVELRNGSLTTIEKFQIANKMMVIAATRDLKGLNSECIDILDVQAEYEEQESNTVVANHFSRMSDCVSNFQNEKYASSKRKANPKKASMDLVE